MERGLAAAILGDLGSKIVLLAGPRQTGKTTLARGLFESQDYFNYDDASHRVALQKQTWRRDVDLLVFDELHKMRQWKRWLKGVYDVQGVRPRLLVTGSSKLDTYRKVGDSLAGRFFLHRLHPFDVKESKLPAEESFERLMRVGGFPEPFLSAEERFYRRWRKAHLDVILRQDLLDLEAVRDIPSIETLVEMLRSRVGSPVSYASLARDLERDPKTIKRWLGVLESLHVVFKTVPLHRNVARSLLKEPKYYFYDNGAVLGDEGTRLENLVACALLKEIERLEDEEGLTARLHYLRTKEGREIDFAVLIDGTVRWLVEAKWADDVPSPHFAHFARYFPKAKPVQLVKKLARSKDHPSGLSIRPVVSWLRELQLVAS